MEQVMNNIDLVRHIYSFGYSKHREYMSEILSAFRHKTFKRKHNIRCLNYDWQLYTSHTEYYSPFDMFISDILSRQQQKEVLKQLIQCRCCTRHSHNKPVVIDKTFYYKESSKRYYNDTDCKCPCRSISRNLWHSLTNHICLHRYKDSPIYMTPHNIKI